ncbi:membrane dipeptidase [Streptomyces sp. NPDC002889]|uniref:membrane dipeptidase n=1 Tax=Streptomyces sp. NPDC002889 TaxID=3364669 RepID=UPI0036BDB3E2
MADLQDGPDTVTAPATAFGDLEDPVSPAEAPAESDALGEVTVESFVLGKVPVELDALGEVAIESDAPGETPAEHDAPAAPEPATETPVAVPPLVRAREILRTHPVADGCSGLGPVLGGMHSYDLETGENLLETDVPRLRAGGVGAQFWSLHVPDPAGPHALAATLDLIDLICSTVADCPEGLRLALSAGDMADARNCGRVAALLGPVAGPAIGDSLAALRACHTLGVRSLSLAGTRWTRGDGLTPFGHEVVREMNRLGILVDLSGCSPDTMRRALAVAKAPVLLSHHPEPPPDDILRGVSANCGVCMVMCTAGTLPETVDLLEHVRDVAGPESVALSGAYDTGLPHAAGLGDVSCFPGLIAELLERDWSEADVAALTWSNIARVVRDADFAARAIQARRPPSRATIDILDA